MTLNRKTATIMLCLFILGALQSLADAMARGAPTWDDLLKLLFAGVVAGAIGATKELLSTVQEPPPAKEE